MIHVQIADDEPYVRNMLRNMVNWTDLGMEIVAEAYDGKEAFHQINDPSLNISLVLTDLKMPVLSGLALIEQCKKKGLNVCFVVVSAYDDFHMVKEAFKLGAVDYLLKSEMTREQIYNVLSHAKNRIEENQEIIPTRELSFIEQEIDKSLLKENLLNKVFRENSHKEVIEQLRRVLNIQRGSRVVLLMLKLIQSSACKTDAEINFEKIIAEYLSNSVHALANCLEMHYEIIQITPFEYGILVLYSSSESASSIMKHLRYLHDMFTPDVYMINVGMSHISTNFMMLPGLVDESRVALNYCFVEGNHSIVRYSNIIDRKSVFYLDVAKQLSELKKLLNALILKADEFNINKVIVHPGYVQACNIIEVRELYARYYFVITDFATQNGFYNSIQPLCYAYESDVRHHADLNGLNHWLMDVIQKLKDATKNNSITARIKYYMNNHYYEPTISLQSVSDEFEMNPCYLSRLFSEKEKVNFSDYLAGLRISKAIEMIKTTNMKIYEICDKVGYSNTEHFSRIFKKITGKSPKQYASGFPSEKID